MKKRITAILCFVCMIVSCLTPLSVQAAPKTDWSGWSGTHRFRDGILCLDANANFKKTLTLPDNYTVKATIRILKKDSAMGFQIMNGKIRSGIYLNTTGFDSFGGLWTKTNVGNGWHDYRVEVRGDQNDIYMDGKKYLSGPANKWTAASNVLFFVQGDGAMEVENFEIITYDEKKGSDGSLLTAPIEEEYAQEFTVDWSDPESYKDWTITDAPEQVKINPETGILTLDISEKPGYYQVERAAKTPDNFDFEFKLKMEKYGDKSFHFKATHPGRNNYQYLRQDRISMVTEPHRLSGGMGLFAEIGTDWHDWKMEIRGNWCTLYLDGGELYRFEQALAPNQQSLLRFLVNAAPLDEYLIHLGKIHYKPYFDKVSLASPANNSEFVEGSDIVFQAETAEKLDYVDYYVNGVKVGKGYAPNYEYSIKNAKLGTYRVSVGVGDQKSVESIITVKKGFNAQIMAENRTVKYGTPAIVQLDCTYLDGNEKVKPSSVEYYADGHLIGKTARFPFRTEFKDLKVGTTAVTAKVTNTNGTHYLTDEYLINVVSDAKSSVKFDREYELNYDFDGGNGDVTGYEYMLPNDISLSSSSLTITFDAIRTGGERPINMRFGNSTSSSSRTYSLNIFSGETGVKYSYKADYKWGSLIAVSRKEVGTDTWVTLTSGTDYSATGVYGKNRSFKFGYLGEWCGTDETKLQNYCGGNAALADVNTKWTFSNLQVAAGYTAGISATVNAAKTQATVGVISAVEFDNVTPIVAVYDGDVLKAVGTATINREGEAVIDLNHNVENPTIKLYVWNSLASGKPALVTALDITANVK